MTTKIPTEFANQRPRQMAHHPAPRRRAADPFLVVGRLMTAFAVLCVVVIFGAFSVFAVGRTADKAPVEPPTSVNNDTAYLQITPQVSTNTPRPTATPEDTRTPYPSPTASEYVQEVHTSDNNLHTNQTTATPYPTYTPYPTLTHYPTDTPVAYTPTSTPNATATQAAFDQKIANSKALRWEYLTWFGFGLLVILSTAFIIILAVSAVRDTLRRKVAQASGETHIEDIQMEYDEMLADVLMLCDVSIDLYGPDAKRLAGYRDVDGLDADSWTEIVNSIAGAGVPLLRQSGVGTFVTKGTLRTYKLRFESGELVPKTPI